MKFNTRKTILNFLIASCLLFSMAGNALAANSDSFLQTQVNDMDPAIQPYAQIIADNIVAIFLFGGGVFLLYDGLMASRKKKKGKTTEAAEYKNDTIETAKQLGLALILFGVFVAVVTSDTLGLV